MVRIQRLATVKSMSVKTFKVDVEGDLNDITSITNKGGDGKVVFGGNQTVNVAGDHNINLNAKVGDITGLTNVTLDAPDFAKKVVLLLKNN